MPILKKIFQKSQISTDNNPADLKSTVCFADIPFKVLDGQIFLDSLRRPINKVETDHGFPWKLIYFIVKSILKSYYMLRNYVF